MNELPVTEGARNIDRIRLLGEKMLLQETAAIWCLRTFKVLAMGLVVWALLKKIITKELLSGMEGEILFIVMMLAGLMVPLLAWLASRKEVVFGSLVLRHLQQSGQLERMTGLMTDGAWRMFDEAGRAMLAGIENAGADMTQKSQWVSLVHKQRSELRNLATAAEPGRVRPALDAFIRSMILTGNIAALLEDPGMRAYLAILLRYHRPLGGLVKARRPVRGKGLLPELVPPEHAEAVLQALAAHRVEEELATQRAVARRQLMLAPVVVAVSLVMLGMTADLPKRLPSSWQYGMYEWNQRLGRRAAALDWLRLMSDDGHSYAQYLLARAYFDGDGVPQDNVMAARLLARSYGRPSPEYQRMYGELHLRDGLYQDPVAACYLFGVAANQGDEKAKDLLAAFPDQNSDNLHRNMRRTMARYNAGKGIGRYDEWEEVIAAVLVNDRAALRTLLDEGVHVDARDDKGNTALIRAVSEDREEIARLLIDRGANVNAVSYEGVTVLTAAVTAGNEKLVRLLLDRDADANVAISGMQSALALAKEQGRAGIVAMLEKWGARE